MELKLLFITGEIFTVIIRRSSAILRVICSVSKRELEDHEKCETLNSKKDSRGRLYNYHLIYRLVSKVPEKIPYAIPVEVPERRFFCQGMIL